MKKIICFVLAIIMIASVTVFAESEESDVERYRDYSASYVKNNDLNGDGKVDGLDLIAYIKYIYSGATGDETVVMHNKAIQIIKLLLAYDGVKTDLDHNGRIGNADLYIANAFLSIIDLNDDDYSYALALRNRISNHIDSHGIDVAPAKDISTLTFPAIVQNAINNKSEPLYSTGRTFLETFHAEVGSTDDSYSRTALKVMLMHDQSDPEGVRYDDPSFFPELDLAGVLDFGNYYRLQSADKDYWKNGINVRVGLTLVLGDTETVESALEKLEHRHFADIFTVTPEYFYPEDQNTFIELPLSEKTYDENDPEIEAYLARYAEYTAPYLDDYDLNCDGTVDADDFEISRNKWSNTITTDTDLSESAAIASILIGFDEKPCDLSRNGIIGEYDISLAGAFRLILRNATGDYAGPSSDDVRIAILDQGGVIGCAEKAIDELTYPEYVQNALNHRKQVAGKSFSEQIPDMLLRDEVDGYKPACISVVPYNLDKGYSYDESYFPELEVIGVKCVFGILTVYLDDTETVAGAVAKLDHRQGADLETVEPEYINYGLPCIDAGDMNNDGKVNAKDVIALMKNIVGGTRLNKDVADVNCDGKINAKDVTILMKKVVNGSTVSGDTSLYCRLLGHKLTASYAKETVHNAYTASPHCVQNTYLVISCGREGCGHIEKILVSSKRIANCHG